MGKSQTQALFFFTLEAIIHDYSVSDGAIPASDQV